MVNIARGRTSHKEDSEARAYGAFVEEHQWQMAKTRSSGIKQLKPVTVSNKPPLTPVSECAPQFVTSKPCSHLVAADRDEARSSIALE
jgi:hypothetical protein